MTAAIDVRGLDKCFGQKHVVRGVSIQVEQGRITGFLGPNGAGKTTTLRLLCGLLTPDGGEGKVLGLDFRTQTDAIKRQTGYMTQRFSLYEDMTIQENLDFVARVHELGDRARRVSDAIAHLGLADRRDQLAGALSGGWKQRLALAAATLHEPKLLLLDEPTAGVDPKARREFWDEIHALADKGLTVLVSTHYMDEAERCHDIGYILNGKLIARGTAHDIIDKSGLITFNGEGSDIGRIVGDLEHQPGVLSASAFGSSVHVSGTDRAALERAIAPFRSDAFRWQEVGPSLEDVFIQLMGDQPDDRYAA
jgi:ABC-2 type transport system ATP-binding protein